VANDALLGDARSVAHPSTAGGNCRNGGATAAGTWDIAARVEDVLVDFLAHEVAALERLDPAIGAFAGTARGCVLAGGKRLRPTFAYWGWRGVVGLREPVTPVLPGLAALELLHTFALVHDDVMDSSAIRRGRPTAHRVLAAEHAAAARGGDADRFGEAAAILLGDLCLVWADRLLATADLPTDVVLESRRWYDRMRVEAVAGQYLDVLGEADSHNWSVERALRVARLKTASYTVQNPLLFGAALTDIGRSVPVAAAYTEYGVAVGEAFQLCDDLLGVFGDSATTGKPAGDDLRTGKPTVLLLLARELAGPAERAELDRVRAGAVSPAGSSAFGPDIDVSRLAAVVAATGAVARVHEMIEQRVGRALAALESVEMDDAARQALADLAVAATHRRA
jgi:geranylgeranyl diphosphate synthase, type I